MLKSIHISNYALIDEIDIAFGPGLNVITGETGAGKSIIIGALSLILGARADSRVVRDSGRKSVIEAVFTVAADSPLRQLCAEADIDWDDSPAPRLIARREIAAGGRSRAFINDTPVPLTRLQEVAIHLVDIHSQHQNLLLAQPQFQLDIIDSLAGNAQLLEEYRARYQKLRVALRALKKLRAELQRSRDDEEFIRYQLEQIEALNLRDGEVEELEREREVQSNLSQVKEQLSIALQALSTGEPSALEQVSTARYAAEALDSLLDPADDIPSRLESLRVELQDIADTIADAGQSLDTSGSSLEEIDDRLTAIYDMQRRHKADTFDELMDLRESLRSRLDLLDGADERVAELERAAKRAYALARESAAKLTESRKAQAARLAEELKNRALPLGMKNLQCVVSVNPVDLNATGADAVEFLFSFNKNAPLLPVGRTASGGEISRLMLSVKAIIAEHIQLPSLILDEIDTGVSGDVAARMGAMMLDISSFTQVIAITHLPQVAARGTGHFKVYKEDDESATHTHIRRLSDEERIDELALMLSGDPSNAAARATACELMSK